MALSETVEGETSSLLCLLDPTGDSGGEGEGLESLIGDLDLGEGLDLCACASLCRSA